MTGSLVTAIRHNGLSTFTRLWHLIRWRRSWDQYDIHYLPDGLGSRFTSAARAVELIPDGAVVASSGFAGCGICSLLFRAVQQSYRQHQHPRDLTWITAGAQGGRGRVPGTAEELAEPGLLKQFVSGHLETVRSLLKLGEQGKLELHTLPQGVIARLFALQGEGNDSFVTDAGVGTFLDTRFDGGSAVTPQADNRFVSAAGDQLRYRLPKIEIALLSAPYADRDGNLYFHDQPVISENRELVAAARRNGGRVIAMVGEIIARNDQLIAIPAGQVDAIAVHPHRPQIAGIPRDQVWDALLPNGSGSTAAGLSMVNFINELLGITPRRNHWDRQVAAEAAELLASQVQPGALTNFGVGLPEQVSRELYQNGQHRRLIFSSEAGAYGGVPTPGIFFGAAVKPRRVESSDWMFQRYREHLDVTVLGFLQVDSDGNVNVSRRGPKVTEFVGPGGFCDIVSSAGTIIFVGSWMVGGAYRSTRAGLKISKPGKPKFVARVDQITFNARQALRQGKKVLYVTNVGIFRLCEAGLRLLRATPGIDVQKDIVEGCYASVLVDDERGDELSSSPRLA